MSKNDLISLEALLKDLSYCAPELWRDEEYIKAKIVKQKVVDAVPVVRCKDCHYWHQELDEVHHWYCTYGWAHQTTPDHYCADGKRRDGE